MSSHPIPFDNTYARLPERFYCKQSPTASPSPQLIASNPILARELGISPDWLHTSEALAAFSGSTTLAGSEPLAQAYAGHQFGGFSPQLGDGRALLLGEVTHPKGRHDIQLKGSGRTPYSRQGDGKSALGPVIREYLLSEAMHTLGVRTTRALAAVTTGDTVRRQEGKVMGGILTRVAASHLRVGTFQYFFARDDHQALHLLADYTIERHFPEATNTSIPILSLLEAVISAQAQLIAHWMSLGFIHGVMNTDNCALSGETIDFGPCAFMEKFHPNCVFSSIDRDARYAWGNQPNIGLWNLSRFADTLLPLLDKDLNKAKEQAEKALSNYSSQFAQQYHHRFSKKFGLPTDPNPDFIRTSLELLAQHRIDFTLFFRHLTLIAQGESPSQFLSLFEQKAIAQNWLALWNTATAHQPNVAAMQKSNPIRIPRNHRVEEAIQAGYQGDFQPFQRLQKALADPYSESTEYEEYEIRPTPDQVVHRTYCGT